MKKFLFTLSFYGVLIALSGQDISSQILNSKSKLPIQYVNIGIAGKNIGTISDSLGNFQLSLREVMDTDTLRISSTAYEEKYYRVGELRENGIPELIYMDDKVVEIREVIISAEKRKPFQLGLKKKHCYPIPVIKFVKSKTAFPQKKVYEIGTLFNNSNTIRLDSIQINFAECNIEDVQLKLNIYSIQKDSIFEYILKQPVFLSLTKKEAKSSPVINIVNRQIKLNSDFLITIENYQELDEGSLYLFANFNSKGKPYPSYYRSTCQGNWIKFMTKDNETVGISILVFGR